MSYTELYKVPEHGPVELAAEFENSWRGAMHVWTKLGERFYGNDMTIMSEPQKIWDLARRPGLPSYIRITLMTTFDNAMVRWLHLPAVADAFEQFAGGFGPGSLLEQAAKLRELSEDISVFAVCWNQTSVNGDIWYVQDDDNLRRYDVSRDSGHWFLFEAKAEATNQ